MYNIRGVMETETSPTSMTLVKECRKKDHVVRLQRMGRPPICRMTGADELQFFRLPRSRILSIFVTRARGGAYFQGRELAGWLTSETLASSGHLMRSCIIRLDSACRLRSYPAPRVVCTAELTAVAASAEPFTRRAGLRATGTAAVWPQRPAAAG